MGVDKLLFIHYSVVKAKQAAVAALEFKIHLCLNHFPIDNCLQKNGFFVQNGIWRYKLQTPPKFGSALLRYENILAHQRLHNDGRMCYKRYDKSRFTKHRREFDEKIYFFIR